MVEKRAQRAVGVLLAAGAALLGIYLLRPPCLILRYTGFTCAGCGTQRMVSAILGGDLPGAFSYNPYMFICLPLGLAYGVWEAWRYVFGQEPLFKSKKIQAVLIGTALLGMLFAVLRNLPGMGWLGP